MKAYFNTTVLRKDITRFAPLWSLYTVFALMYLLLMWDTEGTAARFANNIQYTMRAMGVVNLLYALIAAVLLFGDLFKARMCNMLHAFPVRREGWFLTHLVSGLLFCIVPNALGALTAAALLQQYSYMAFLWLAITVLQYLFFFGVAVFCILCVGNGLGATAVYTIVNFLAVLGGWLAQNFYEPFLYGIRIDLRSICRFSPVVMFSDSLYMETHYDNVTSATVFDGFTSPQSWYYLYAAAAVGVVLTVLALLIYRRRALETAGDFISLSPVGPVFLFIYTLCVGAVLYFVATAMSGELRYLFLGLGFAIGFFTGRMLLERKVNVFRWKNFLAFGIFSAVFAATVGLTVLDPIGITRYVPEAGQVESVTLSPYEGIYSINRKTCLLTDPEDVETVIGLHQDALGYRNGVQAVTVPVSLRYTLKNGTTLERNYRLPEIEYKPLLRGFWSRPACVLGTEDPGQLLEGLYTLEFYSYDDSLPYIYMSNTPEDLPYVEEKYGSEVKPLTFTFTGSFADQPVARGLLEAVYADCLEGTMSQWWNKHESVGSLSLQLEVDGQRQYWDITLYQGSRHTLAYLESLTTE